MHTKKLADNLLVTQLSFNVDIQAVANSDQTNQQSGLKQNHIEHFLKWFV